MVPSLTALERAHVRRSPQSFTVRVLAVAAACIMLSGCAQVSGLVGDMIPDRPEAHVLEVGDCFNNTVTMDPQAGELVDVPRENCTLAHDNEVIATVDLDGEKFPGEEKLLLKGYEVCLPEFEKFIGVTFDEAGTLAYDFFTPTEASWELGDREVLCYVFDSDQQTEYSLKGVGAERLAEPDAEDGAGEEGGDS